MVNIAVFDDRNLIPYHGIDTFSRLSLHLAILSCFNEFFIRTETFPGPSVYTINFMTMIFVINDNGEVWESERLCRNEEKEQKYVVCSFIFSVKLLNQRQLV